MKKNLLFTILLLICLGNTLMANLPSFEGARIYDSQKRSAYKNKADLNLAVQKIDQTLTRYDVFNIDVRAIEQYIKTNQSMASFYLNLDNKQIELNVSLHDILSADFKHYEQGANGLIVHQKPAPFTYQGYTDNPSDKNVVLTIRGNWMSGFFTYQNERYFLTPLKQFDSSYKNENSMVLYTAKDSKYPSFDCHAGRSNPDLGNQIISSPKNAAIIECTEMAVAYDQGFKNLHNDAQGVQNIIISRLNMVSNLYRNWFEIDYLLIELYETANNEITPDNNFESCQEVFPDCSENTILDDFREWGEGQAQSPNFGNGFSSDPDVATFWTDRDIVDGNNALNIGYSHFEGICNERGYNICEDAERYRGNEPLQMTLWAHELGHTWNAYHTSQNNTYLMNSSVTAEAVNVSTATVDAIALHKSTRTCLDAGGCNSHCNNGVQDEDETGVDCGGADCISCPSCTDGVQNGSETGIDCGGADCPACPPEICTALDFNANTILAYSNDQGTATIQDNGATLLLENNAEKAIEINYTVTAATILQFDFKSTVEGASHYIGFDNDLNGGFNGAEQQFGLYGSQFFGCGSLNETNNCAPYTGAGNWQSFEVPLADIAGNWQYLVLAATASVFGASGDSYFRNVTIYEDYNGNQECDESSCDPAQAGTACDDNDACTTGDVYDANCNCVGTFADADNDGVCDSDDACPGFDDALIGTSCDDSDACTTDDVYDANCNCAGTFADADGDGICDADEGCSTSPELMGVFDGDVYVRDDCSGIILTAPSGSCFKIVVNSTGELTTIPVTCP